MLPILGALVALAATLFLVNLTARSAETAASLQREVDTRTGNVALDMHCLSDATSVPALKDLEKNMEAIDRRLQQLRRANRDRYTKGIKRY